MSNIILSPMEVKIIDLMSQEYNSKAIAGKLNLTHKAVAMHRERLLQKTRCLNSIGLVLWAVKNNIIILR
jgi:DNA-binding CsgD family transcriptional regulator